VTQKQLKDNRQLDILGIKVENWSWDEGFSNITGRYQLDNKQSIFAFINAHNANISMRDPQYRNCINEAIVLPDGVGVDFATKISNGQKFKANLNGTDLIPALMVYFQKPMKVALIGGENMVVNRAAEKFKAATPWHEFVVVSDGYFNREDIPKILSELKAEKPDILLVGMGSPMQEKWVEEYVTIEHAKLVFTVGALFDFVSHIVPRAPASWRKLRIEWIYRLSLEPKRLWRRYILGNPLFLWHVVRKRYFNDC
jgi:exopolysaccharide biosynthesis WecB/TagA/CpsF family protein